MPDNRDAATLLDLAKAARKVLAFKQGINKAAFLDDAKTQSAIVYQLLIIGEAVKRLSQDYRRQHPEIPWTASPGCETTSSIMAMMLILMKCGKLLNGTFQTY